MNKYPKEIVDLVDVMVHQSIYKMSPKEIGLMVHPDGRPIKLNKVPEDVIQDHLNRYTKRELKRGQSFLVRNKYTFFMDHETKKKRQN